LQLFQIAHAIDAPGFLLGFGQGGQEQRGQNGNDGNDHEQLDKSERHGTTRWPGHVSPWYLTRAVQSMGHGAALGYIIFSSFPRKIQFNLQNFRRKGFTYKN
jgi:hypothetical protein